MPSIKRGLKYNGQMKKEKKANNLLQNSTQNTKYWAAQTPQKKAKDDITLSGRISSSCSTRNVFDSIKQRKENYDQPKNKTYHL